MSVVMLAAQDDEKSEFGECFIGVPLLDSTAVDAQLLHYFSGVGRGLRMRVMLLGVRDERAALLAQWSSPVHLLSVSHAC